MTLASIYVAVLITNWNSANVITGSLSPSGFSFWVKVSIAWVTTLLYIWTIIAPKILRQRDFNVWYYFSSKEGFRIFSEVSLIKEFAVWNCFMRQFIYFNLSFCIVSKASFSNQTCRLPNTFKHPKTLIIHKKSRPNSKNTFKAKSVRFNK